MFCFVFKKANLQAFGKSVSYCFFMISRILFFSSIIFPRMGRHQSSNWPETQLLSYDTSLVLYQMMIYELLLLCSFEIILDFCSTIFKAAGRSDFLKNMVLKSALNLNIWKSKSIWQVWSQLDACVTGSKVLHEFVGLGVCVRTHTAFYASFLVEVSVAGFCSCFSFQGENLEYQFASFCAGAGFIFLAATKPQKGKTKQSLTIKKMS